MKNKYFFILLLFLSLPLKAAEMEQYCTTSLADGNFHKTDCSVNTNFEGKKYCFGNKASKSVFIDDPKTILAKANTTSFSISKNILRSDTAVISAISLVNYIHNDH